jgi:hypothetical protein
MTRIFVSHSGKDGEFVDDLVELLRVHYLDTWYAKRDISAGRWEPEIYSALKTCDWFLVALSPDAVDSEWVAKEVELAMAEKRLHDNGRIIPVLVRPCEWQRLHPRLFEFQLFDFTIDAEEAKSRLLATWQIERYTLPQVRVGDVFVPVYRIVGGNGKVRYEHPEGIVCNAPLTIFCLPPDIAQVKGTLVEKQLEEARLRGAVFENRPMVRLNQCSWGLREGDDQSWPLQLDVGLTDYFTMRATNVSISEKLPDGSTIEQKYAAPLDDLGNSQLANPLATNLSLVTSDRKIYITQRGLRVGWNPGGFAPAVSGTGNPTLDIENGTYNPFLTAQRETTEEATSPLVPDLAQITFFGLARTFKYRFPFLFGEVRLDITSEQLESQVPLDSWENRGLVAIPFTIEGVTDWMSKRYREVVGRRGLGPAVGTTLFSLLQSLLYEFPDDWQKVIAALQFKQR